MSSAAAADTNRDTDVTETAVLAVEASWESCCNFTHNCMMRICFRMFPRCERVFILN
jgi:hypothetical protein